jgi:hypothetical protein
MVNWMHVVAYVLNTSELGVLMPLLILFSNRKDLRGIETHKTKR